MSQYTSQKDFFDRAYRTGTDTWTHIPFTMKGGELIHTLKPNSMVLDLGSGRGQFPFDLAKYGHRAIGLDTSEASVLWANEQVRDRGIQQQLRFVVGDVLDIPFANESFDAVCDVGLLQHVSREDWSTYRDEVLRVLKPKGFYFLIAYAKQTDRFFTFSPKQDKYGDFEHEGVYYHFFTQEELSVLFGDSFETVSLRVEHVQVHRDDVGYYVILLQKK